MTERPSEMTEAAADRHDGPRNRRIDRVLDPSYAGGLGDLALEDLRARRDECMAEREYLSLLRRLLQGRAEILSAEVSSRGAGGDREALIGRLAKILADDEHPASPRGEMVKVALPEEELTLARRRVERLVNDTALSDPTALGDDELQVAIEAIGVEEEQVSDARRRVIEVLDALQDELKRRYKDDPTLALR